MELYHKRYQDGGRILYHPLTRRAISIHLGYPFAYVILDDDVYLQNDIIKYGEKVMFDNGKFEDWWVRIVRIQIREQDNLDRPNLAKEAERIKSEIKETLDDKVAVK